MKETKIINYDFCKFYNNHNHVVLLRPLNTAFKVEFLTSCTYNFTHGSQINSYLCASNNSGNNRSNNFFNSFINGEFVHSIYPWLCY